MAGEPSRDNGGRRDMTAPNYTLVIGDKNLSSWSLRPWLAMKHCGIPFAEECIRLRQPDSKAKILRHSPGGKVPVLKARAGVVWDSLAIFGISRRTSSETSLVAARCRGSGGGAQHLG
jgi:hypothetical protein